MSSKDVSDIGKEFQNKNPNKIVELHIRHKGLDHDQIKFINHANVKDVVAHLKKSGAPLMINDSRMSFVYQANGKDSEYLTHIFYDKNKFNAIKAALKNHNGNGNGNHNGNVQKNMNMQDDYFGSVYNNLFGGSSGTSPKRTKLPQLPIEDRIPSPDKIPVAPELKAQAPARPPVGQESGPDDSCPFRRQNMAMTPRSLAMTPLSQLGGLRSSNLYQSEFDRGCGCGGGAKSGNGQRGSRMGYGV